MHTSCEHGIDKQTLARQPGQPLSLPTLAASLMTMWHTARGIIKNQLKLVHSMPLRALETATLRLALAPNDNKGERKRSHHNVIPTTIRDSIWNLTAETSWTTEARNMSRSAAEQWLAAVLFLLSLATVRRVRETANANANAKEQLRRQLNENDHDRPRA